MFLWLIWVHWRPTHPEYSHTRFVFFAPNWYTLPRTAATCDSGVATKSLRLCLQWAYCPSWLEGTSFQLMEAVWGWWFFSGWEGTENTLYLILLSLVSSSSFIYRFLSESYICASTQIHLVLLLYLIHLACAFFKEIHIFGGHSQVSEACLTLDRSALLLPELSGFIEGSDNCLYIYTFKEVICKFLL